MKGRRKAIIGDKVRNVMFSTSTCTFSKGNGKVKIIWRGSKGISGRLQWLSEGGGGCICIYDIGVGLS